jgi:hypothetical protein
MLFYREFSLSPMLHKSTSQPSTRGLALETLITPTSAAHQPVAQATPASESAASMWARKMKQSVKQRTESMNDMFGLSIGLEAFPTIANSPADAR